MSCNWQVVSKLDKDITTVFGINNSESLVQYEMSLSLTSGSVQDGEMETLMKLEDLVSIDQMMDFLSGTQAVTFSVLRNKDI